ncbi:MAG TPA: hypothetical protein VEM38_13235 [Burkholderiales bacterium]|nr:hypothetical protein [Burkholderiales bacterium]
MPLPIVGYAPLNGWRQIGAPHWSIIMPHRFEATKDGQLAHFTDDQLRATVPPEGWDDYLAAWPEAQPIVDRLRNPSKATIADAMKQGAGLRL